MGHTNRVADAVGVKMARASNAGVGAVVVLTVAAVPVWAEVTRDDIRSANAASQAAIVTLQARGEGTYHFNPAHIPPGASTTGTDKYVIENGRAGGQKRTHELPV